MRWFLSSKPKAPITTVATCPGPSAITSTPIIILSEFRNLPNLPALAALLARATPDNMPRLIAQGLLDVLVIISQQPPTEAGLHLALATYTSLGFVMTKTNASFLFKYLATALFTLDSPSLVLDEALTRRLIKEALRSDYQKAGNDRVLSFINAVIAPMSREQVIGLDLLVALTHLLAHPTSNGPLLEFFSHLLAKLGPDAFAYNPSAHILLARLVHFCPESALPSLPSPLAARVAVAALTLRLSGDSARVVQLQLALLEYIQSQLLCDAAQLCLYLDLGLLSHLAALATEPLLRPTLAQTVLICFQASKPPPLPTPLLALLLPASPDLARFLREGNDEFTAAVFCQCLRNPPDPALDATDLIRALTAFARLHGVAALSQAGFDELSLMQHPKADLESVLDLLRLSRGDRQLQHHTSVADKRVLQFLIRAIERGSWSASELLVRLFPRSHRSANPSGKQELIEALMCAICKDLMRCPQSVGPCKHCFCKPCLDIWLRSSPSKDCPLCRTKIATRGINISKLSALIDLRTMFNVVDLDSSTEGEASTEGVLQAVGGDLD